LAAELKQRYGVDAEIKKGHKGIFDVEVDGELVYSKYDTHRFPKPNEIIALIDTNDPR
jgi:selT/selW/selH-like putative selenoprotein